MGGSFRIPAASLNESPSEKEGKSAGRTGLGEGSNALNESPSEKEGKSSSLERSSDLLSQTLNESPSEKEGKCSLPAMLL